MDLLLIAQSSRMLAQSAVRGGYQAYAIDCYADSDTFRHSARCIGLNHFDGFDEAELLSAANQLSTASAFVYGSGIDTRPELVEILAQGRHLFGNPPGILAKINQPHVFFSLLDKLGVPYPETRFTPPDSAEGWLSKPAGGEGGKGIAFFAKHRPVARSVYFQRHVNSPAYSILFLANGKETRTIGFNTLWTANHDPAQPFIFAGAINRDDLSQEQRSTAVEYAGKLTAATGLVGLNSLDFVLDSGKCLALELNPRPSATMTLYDEDFAEGLVSAHIAACRGELPPPPLHFGPIRGLLTVFNRQDSIIPGGFAWPEECADIPNPGTLIKSRQPVCSLLAKGTDVDAIKNRLNSLENQILLSIPL